MAGKGFKLADAYVEVHGDGTNVGDDIAADAEKGTGKASKGGLSLAKGVIGGFVAYEGFKRVGEFLGDSISAASDLNETVSASQAVFGSSAGAISKWADTAAVKLGLSKQAAIDSATSFGDMFLQMGFTGAQATSQSKNLVQMAADLGSFKNLPTGDVLDMISGAMRGEYDSLQRLIPNISAARVQHEAMALGLVKSTVDTKKLADANTAADLAQQSYNDAVKKHGASSTEAQRAGLALSKANDAVTTASEGTTEQMSAQAQAQAVLSIINKDGARAQGDFAKTSSGVANQQKIMAAQTEDLKASLGNALLPIVKTLLNVFNTVFLPVIKSVADWIGKNTAIVGPLLIVLGLLAVAVWAVNAAMYANPITLIIIGIMLLIVAVVLLVTNWDAVVKFLLDVWNGFVSWFMGVMDGFFGWWNGMWAGLFGFVADVWNGFVSWVLGVWNGFIAWIMAGVTAYYTFWIGIWAAIVGFVITVWNALVAWVVAVWTGFITWIVAGITGFNAFWSGVWGAIASFVIGVWNGIVGWITGVWAGFVGWLVSILNGFVAGWNSIWAGVASFLSGIWNGIVSVAKNTWNGLIAWFKSVPKMIMDTFNGAVSWLSDIGKNIVNGLWDGLRAAWDNFMRWWNGIVGGITDVAKALLGIKSPSRVFRYEVGYQIVEGARLGIEDQKANLERTVRDTFDIAGTAHASGTAGSPADAFGFNSSKPKGGDTYILRIDRLELNADQLSDMAQALDTLKKLSQTARQGQGQTTATIG